MTTRAQLLALLEGKKGVYCSGEEIAGRLGLSRAAVWKAIKALQGDGYPIDAAPNKGYCLSAQADVLSPQGIRQYVSPECPALSIDVVPIAASTNALAREKAQAGAPEGYLVLANSQTAGRGRLGRSFFSPPGTGVYMSLLLRPKDVSAQQAVKITTIAAVAMCEAIEEISDEKAQIKWINDIFIRGRKVCGILTEASFGLENSLLEYAVLGLGVNVYTPPGGFPPELAPIVGAVLGAPLGNGKNRLTAGFLNHFWGYYSALEKPDYAEAYRNRSLVLGKRVRVVSAGGTKEALALALDDDCRLLVRDDDGVEEWLSSGEISIRL